MNSELIDKNQELENCNFVKTILMIMVVLGHSLCFWNGNWFTKDPVFGSKLLSLLSDWIGEFHIYGFVLVSGYLFYYIKFEKDGYRHFIPFILNKSKRLLIPYIFVAVAWVIPISYFFFKNTFSDIVIRYFLATSPSQLWFLVMLFDVFVISWLLSDFFAENNFLSIVVVLFFYGLSLIGGSFVPNIFGIWRACNFLPLFWIGFKIRQYGSGALFKIPSIVWIGIQVLLFAIYKCFLGLDGAIFKLVNLGIGFLLHIVGAVMAFIVLQKIANITKWQNSKVFSLLTRCSMPVYLFHQQIIYFFIYWLNGVINPYLNASINFIGAMILSLLISSFLLHYKTTRFLIGEK